MFSGMNFDLDLDLDVDTDECLLMPGVSSRVS